MPVLDSGAVAILISGLVTAVVAVLAARVYYGWRIRRWASARQLTLVDWRGAWFYEGPASPFRSRYQHAFWIEVEDRDGLPATGWLTFQWWAFGSEPEIEWN